MISRSQCIICRKERRPARLLHSIRGAAGLYVFDITKAAQIVQFDRRDSQFISRGTLERLLKINDLWHQDHLDHVDAAHPGLMGPFFGGMVLLDGIHRAAKAYRDGLPYYVNLLTFAELNSCRVDNIVLTPEAILAEIRAMLSSNLGAVLNVDVELEPGISVEQLIRERLLPEENRRVHFVVHGKGLRKSGQP